MATKQLKKALEDAQALQDRSSGKDTLRDVLVDMAKAGPLLRGVQAVIAVASLDQIILPFPVRVTGLLVQAGDWGNTTDTIVAAEAASTIATVTIPHTTLNGSEVFTPLDVEVPANTPIELEVTQAPTAGSNFLATLLLSPINVE